MLRALFTLISLVALLAWAAGPQESSPGAAVAAETVKMGGGYSHAVKIPVDAANTEFIAAAMFKPEGAGPFPAVIILSGCYGVGPDVGIVKRINADYLPKGIATLVIDSFTPRGLSDGCGGANVGSLADDAYAAMAWLARRPDIDAKHVFLQGYSLGATAAIEAIDPKRAANQTQKFAGVIAFYPRCDRDAKFSAPTIILIGESDASNLAFICEGIRDKTNVEVTVYPKATHSFAMPGLDKKVKGHHWKYDKAASNDAQRRALALIQSLRK